MPQVTYRDPFRSIYEWPAIAAWLASMAALLTLAFTTALPKQIIFACLAVCLAMTLRMVPSVVSLHRFRRRLRGQPLSFMNMEELATIMPEARKRKGVFLGYGFEWRQEHAQVLDHVMRSDPALIRRIDARNSTIGRRWIHGIGKKVVKLWISLEALAGHLLIVGTTGAGKTRFFESLIAQAIMRGEPVIVIDPKGDRDMCEGMRQLCAAMGQEDRFVYFHPGHASRSVRLDPLRNFSRSTEPASRIASLISAAGDDPFKNFGQMEMNNLVQGMLLINAKPSLVLMRRYLEGGVEGLLVKACEAWFEKKMPGWRKVAEPYKQGARTATELAKRYVQFYRDKFQQEPGCASSELEGLIASFEHDKAHYTKMIATLLPLLNQLTTGELSQLLSPDPNSLSEDRDITNFNTIIKKNQVAYIGLDTLSDPIVGAAVGSLVLADLTALAGARYNYRQGRGGEEDDSVDAADFVNIFVDEAAEVMNEPCIQLLNKGRGAGFRGVLATQTFADFSARTNSRDKATQILGNVNNVVVLRVRDSETQSYLTDNFMKTYVQQLERGSSMAAGSKADLHYGGTVNESIKHTEVPIFPPQLLGTLPNLEWFANVAGGAVYKGLSKIIDKSKPISPGVLHANGLQNPA